MLNTIKITSLLFLLLAIVVQFNFMPRYQTYGGDLLNNQDFETGLAGWNVLNGKGDIKIADGVATFVNKDSRSSVVLSKSLPAPLEKGKILVRADTRIKDVIGGPLSFQRARISLVGRDNNGTYLFTNRHMVLLIKGTKAWTMYSAVIPVAEEAVDLVFSFGLTKSSGLMEVRNISLYSASERPAFRILSFTLLGLLVGVLLWISVPFFLSMPWSLVHAGTAIIGAAILVAVVLPASSKRQAIDLINPLAKRGGNDPLAWLTDMSVPFGGELYRYLQQSPDKVGHFLFFVLLAGFSRMLWRHLGLGATTFYLLIFAATTEILQFFAPGRTPSVADFGIDGAGILTGLALVSMVQFFHGNISRNPRKA